MLRLTNRNYWIVRTSMADESAALIGVQINGQALQISRGSSVSALLDAVAIRSPLVAVEINGQVISRSQHGQFLLSDGDVVEAVTLVGGG